MQLETDIDVVFYNQLNYNLIPLSQISDLVQIGRLGLADHFVIACD